MNTQLELTEQQLYRAGGRGNTQADRILHRLQETPGEWVPMPELARIGAGGPTRFCMVHSRIADLRKRGFTIDQRGGHESEYRLTMTKAEGQEPKE